MPRRELLARTFPSMNPASAIRKRRTYDPGVHAWCKLTVATWKKGKSHILYQHAIDRYRVEALEVSDHSRRVMTYWDSSTCDLCKDIFPRYTVCRHGSAPAAAVAPAPRMRGTTIRARTELK